MALVEGILVESSNASMALGGPGLAEHSTSPAYRRDIQRPYRHAPPTAGDAPGLAVRECDLLQNLLVQGQVCNRSPQASVLLLEDLQPLGLNSRSVAVCGSTTDRAFVCAPAVRATSGLTTSSKPPIPALTTGGLSGC